MSSLESGRVVCAVSALAAAASVATGLFPARWTPIDQNSDRRGRSLDDGFLDQEALSVGGDRELIAGLIDGESRIEQRARNCGIDIRIDSKIHRHDPPVEPQVEELLTIMPPSGLHAAVRRDLTF